MLRILALPVQNFSLIWVTALTIQAFYVSLKAQMWSFFYFLGWNQISDGYLVHLLCKMFKKWTKSWLFWRWQCKTLVLIRIAVLILGEFLIKNWSFWAVKTLLGLAFDRFFIILLKTVKKMEKSDPFGVFWGKM